MPVLNRLFASALLAVAGGAVLGAAELGEHPEYVAAERALRDGLPQVAAVKANRLLEESRWDSLERTEVAKLAVEAWIRAEKGDQVLAVLDREEVPQEAMRRAQAHLLLREYAKAQEVLEARRKAGDFREAERFLLLQAHLAQGHIPEARETLRPLLRSGNPRMLERARLARLELDVLSGTYAEAKGEDVQKGLPHSLPARLLRARAWMDQGRLTEAEEVLRGLLATAGGGEHVHHKAALLLAESLLKQGKTPESIESLIQFLDHVAASDLWPEAFDLLNRAIGTGELPNVALRWIAEGNTAQHSLAENATSSVTGVFQGHAMLLAARWLVGQQRPYEALGLLEGLLQVYPKHPQKDQVMRLAVETYGKVNAEGRVDVLARRWRQEARDGGSAMVDLVTGGAAFARGDFSEAAELFQSAARLAPTLSERRGALYNAGIAALKAGQVLLFQNLLGQLEVASAGTQEGTLADGAADLELAKALDAAAKQEAGAAAQLRAFVEKHPKHVRVTEAQIAIAEVSLLASPPDFKAAGEALSAAALSREVSPAVQQRIAYTRIWMLDKQGDLAGVVAAGTEFLQNWPTAALAAEVRMKVADAYFRQENFASARTEFELVVKEYPTSPFADTALYFAGMSALSMMSDEGRETAISLWQELAEKGGPLSIPARQQQALAKRRAGQELEALNLLDALLTEKSLGEDLRRSLMCEKAEVLILLGKTQPARLKEAAEVLQALRRDPNLPYFWRARAGYTLAAALSEAGKPLEALEACYDVVEAAGAGGPANPAEFRWYYRAGFFGIDLLESAMQWEAAARLAEKLAQPKGERATEARERATKIRLEHFLWDGTSQPPAPAPAVAPKVEQ